MKHNEKKDWEKINSISDKWNNIKWPRTCRTEDQIEWVKITENIFKEIMAEIVKI